MTTGMSPQYSQSSCRHGPHGGVGVGGVGDDGDHRELALAFGQRLEQRDALGADGQAVRRVLDVAAGEDAARPRSAARRRP